jgi:hypothetical protein
MGDVYMFVLRMRIASSQNGKKRGTTTMVSTSVTISGGKSQNLE